MGYRLLVFWLLLPLASFSQSGLQLLYDMAEHTQKVVSFTATITKTERIEGEYIKQISAVKLHREPFMIYLRQRYPKDGVEILCRSDRPKALVNPNSFPWINLSLDPYGSLMRRNQHHTVYDSGFDLMTNILLAALKTVGSDTSDHVKYFGTKKHENRDVHHLEFINPSYRIINYKVKEKETVIDVAKKLNVNEYYILELNDNVDYYDDVDPGQVIKVPSHYASRMTLFIDADYMLPMVIWSYDDKGLFEKYAYSEFILNPPLDPSEFTTDYPEYDF
jgi:outer membrane lipoprotein-sorting protein